MGDPYTVRSNVQWESRVVGAKVGGGLWGAEGLEVQVLVGL